VKAPRNHNRHHDEIVRAFKTSISAVRHREQVKILLIHNFYQQFGGEDAAALADKALLESHYEDVLFYTRDNSEIHDFTWVNKLLFPAQVFYSRRTKRDLQKIVKERRPNIALIHNFFPLVSPSVYHFLHSRGIPIIQVIHDFRFFCPNGWFFTQGQICERCKAGNYLNAVRFRCYRDSYLSSTLAASSIGLNRRRGMLEKITAFICLTDFLKQKLLEGGIPEEKIFIRPHFMDTSAVAPCYRKGEYALYLGRISPEKGIWTMVRAFQRLKRVRLKIAGTGPMEAALGRYVKENAVENVELVGFKSGADKWKLLADSLFVVAPSECYETFGLAVLEAYAAGKPVVASNLGSLPYVVEDGKSGVLFEPGNVEDLIEKVNGLLANPSSIASMGSHARGLAEMKYSPGQSYRTLLDIASKLQ
jgi:glycosyltransferase involved in cell wall biosynthesis